MRYHCVPSSRIPVVPPRVSTSIVLCAFAQGEGLGGSGTVLAARLEDVFDGHDFARKRLDRAPTGDTSLVWERVRVAVDESRTMSGIAEVAASGISVERLGFRPLMSPYADPVTCGNAVHERHG